ncbi:hypothetical protein CRYUN_Cryun01aG0139600 [Craigia yunnanensis]
MVALIRRRLFCTKISQNNHQHQLQWSVKQNTGSFSAAWHRVSFFDIQETAYIKARHAADRFQLLQFAVCPLTISGSKVTSHPYNFHLFPRDELNIGMPSYSFSCQTSYLTAMAQQGFDFNACIYDEALVKSLKKLVLGGEQYGSRPCMAIDVCSEHQVKLVLEMLGEFSDDLVALKIPTKGGGTQAVSVILTSSKEDKSLFERELQNVEEE